jgi:hypothetical protein
MRHHLFVAVAVAAAVSLSACGTTMDDQSAGRAHAASLSASDDVSTSSQSQDASRSDNPTAVQLAALERPEQYADLSCRGGSRLDDSSVSIESLSAGVMQLADGSIGLFIDDTASTFPLGCMSAQTAAVSRSEGLSFVAVNPINDGVLVVIAVPSGRRLQALPWLSRGGEAHPSAEVGFDVYLYLATAASVERQPELMGPSEGQLAAMVNEAFAGASLVGGLAPDLLVSP